MMQHSRFVDNKVPKCTVCGLEGDGVFLPNCPGKIINKTDKEVEMSSKETVGNGKSTGAVYNVVNNITIQNVVISDERILQSLVNCLNSIGKTENVDTVPTNSIIEEHEDNDHIPEEDTNTSDCTLVEGHDLKENGSKEDLGTYGDDIVDDLPEDEEDEEDKEEPSPYTWDETLHLLYRLKDKDTPHSEIITILNAEGYRTKQGKRFNHNNFCALIRRLKQTGILL